MKPSRAISTKSFPVVDTDFGTCFRRAVKTRSMQVVTLLRETVLGPYRLDQFGFDDAHVCLVVNLGLNERDEILEILLGNHGELVGPVGTGVVQCGEIPRVGIDFTGDLNNFNIIAGGIPAHDGQSPGSREVQDSDFVNTRRLEQLKGIHLFFPII